MYHSLTIGTRTTQTKSGSTYSVISGKNTWDDWFLIPSTRPLVNPPKPNTKGIQVPGRNGTLDMSTVLTGYMTYQNRTGSWEFIVDNDHWDWSTAYSTIMGYLHGQDKYVALEDDKEFYYKGLLSVNSWKSDKSWSLITIDYDLHPYKRTIQSSEEDWLWDPFNFETGVIRDYNTTIPSGGSVTFNVYGYLEPTLPWIYSSSSNVTALYKGSSHGIDSGKNKYSWFKLDEGMNSIEFTNNASSSVRVYVAHRGGVF